MKRTYIMGLLGALNELICEKFVAQCQTHLRALNYSYCYYCYYILNCEVMPSASYWCIASQLQIAPPMIVSL